MKTLSERKVRGRESLDYVLRVLSGPLPAFTVDDYDYDYDYDKHDLAASREGTVFVIDAERFAEFLFGFKIGNQGLNRFI